MFEKWWYNPNFVHSATTRRLRQSSCTIVEENDSCIATACDRLYSFPHTLPGSCTNKIKHKSQWMWSTSIWEVPDHTTLDSSFALSEPLNYFTHLHQCTFILKFPLWFSFKFNYAFSLPFNCIWYHFTFLLIFVAHFLYIFLCLHLYTHSLCCFSFPKFFSTFYYSFTAHTTSFFLALCNRCSWCCCF